MNKHIIQTIDGHSIRLQTEHDFTWLAEYGRVFKVFDDKDSGNILFGVVRHGEKRFIKYAGAYTLDYHMDAQDAIKRLQGAAKKYDLIRHPALIPLISHGRAGDGYVLVFPWRNGECLHDYWSFTKRIEYKRQKNYLELVKYQHPDAPMVKFKHLSMEKRIHAYRMIMDFVLAAHDAGYQPHDFNDNQIMYDFETDRVWICDIDLFIQKPVKDHEPFVFPNPKRFRSPEEEIDAASMDEVTSVYHLGVFAFVIFGHEYDKSIATWNAPDELFKFAQRATAYDRRERYQSVADMMQAFQQIAGVGER